MEELKYLTPKCCKEKRNYRIKQAKSFDKGINVENQIKIQLFKNDEIELGFYNPGKDDGKLTIDGKRKTRDMTPYVEAKNFPINKGKFEEIWKIVLNLQQVLSKNSTIKFYRLIYRLAYMFDFELNTKTNNYELNDKFLNEVQEIQDELDKANSRINLKSFISFLDLLGWNEDYKYQFSDNVADNPYSGRLNCLLCMISVPIELSKLNIKEGEKINFDSLLEMCYTFSMSRGIFVLGKNELISELELTEK